MNVFEFERLGDGDFEGAVGDEAREEVEGGGPVVGAGVFKPAAEPEAVEGEVVEDEEAVGHLDGLAGHRSVGDVDAAGGESAGEVESRGSADGVEREAGRRVGEGAGLAKVDVVGEDQVGTEGGEFRDELGAADEVERFQSEMLGDGDDAAADAGVGGVLDDPVSGFEADEGVEHRVGGRRIDAEHGGLLRVDVGRDGNGVGGGEVAVPAPVAERGVGDEVADGEIGHV